MISAACARLPPRILAGLLKGTAVREGSARAEGDQAILRAMLGALLIDRPEE